MTYEDAVKKINSLLTFGIKPGLERIRELLDRIGNPQKNLKFVHIAGTNGKGSTCTFISSVLTAAGYKTGLFTSPYVTEFRERIQIDKEMIPKDELANAFDVIVPIVEQMANENKIITEFEMITALAFYWYNKAKCDIVVLETGLGGRFDATNVINNSEVSVITSIALDHTAILGDTIEKIAFEKAGIIKENSYTVLYPCLPMSALNVIKDTALKRNSVPCISDYNSINTLSSDINGTNISYKNLQLFIPLTGEHQIKNASVALKAIEILRIKGYDISDISIKEGFSNAFIPARMEIISKNPLVILDGGHNPDCANAVSDNIKKYLINKKILAVFGMLEDKDSKSSVEILAPLFNKIITVKPNNPRGLDSNKLKKIIFPYCSNVISAENAEIAFNIAKNEISGFDMLFIGGSLYLAGELRPLLLKEFR